MPDREERSGKENESEKSSMENRGEEKGIEQIGKKEEGSTRAMANPSRCAD